MRYYIADMHFYHSAINEKLDCRGFPNVEKMNEYLIRKWNEKVRVNDDVVILGDFSMGNAEQTNRLLHQLNGKLYLITGNHDLFVSQKGVDRQRFQWIRPYEELSDDRRRVVLCHYPIIFYNGQYRLDENGMPNTYMLYGHVHDTQDQRLLEQFQEITRSVTVKRNGKKTAIPCNMINCFCMYSGYEPLTLDEWIENDRARRKKQLLKECPGMTDGQMAKNGEMAEDDENRRADFFGY